MGKLSTLAKVNETGVISLTTCSALIVFMEKTNYRNEVRQVIRCKDGKVKVVWHKKKFSHATYGDYKAFWKAHNEAPKENSKRQQKLRLLTSV
jgi:hypothetical protein